MGYNFSQLEKMRNKIGREKTSFWLEFLDKSLSTPPSLEDNAAHKQPPPFAWTHQTSIAPSFGVVCHLHFICSLLRCVVDWTRFYFESQFRRNIEVGIERLSTGLFWVCATLLAGHPFWWRRHVHNDGFVKENHFL